MKAFTRWEPFNKHWNPWKDTEDLEQRLSTFLRQPAPTEDDHEAIAVAEWTPLVDISEDQREYLIKAELPEINKDDVKLTVQHNVLRLCGERKSERQGGGKKYHRRERAYGRFIRTFSLPDDTDATDVSAEYRDGILLVHVPKRQTAGQKAIAVKAA